MVSSGLKDSREGKTISNKEMKYRISAWQKIDVQRNLSSG